MRKIPVLNRNSTGFNQILTDTVGYFTISESLQIKESRGSIFISWLALFREIILISQVFTRLRIPQLYTLETINFLTEFRRVNAKIAFMKLQVYH
jgi:hypothetical protein